jgi:hypothetical protein
MTNAINMPEYHYWLRDSANARVNFCADERRRIKNAE